MPWRSRLVPRAPGVRGRRLIGEMKTKERIVCVDFPCQDMDHTRYTLPPIAVDPASIRILMVAEAPARDPADDFWAADDAFYMRTTRQAFEDAGVEVGSVREMLELGIFMTTAVKCAKTGSAIKTASLKSCARLLEDEIVFFPHLKAILCMGDVAIRAVNDIARRTTGARAIPSGSTYKIRGTEYRWGEVRVFPSYLQTGKSYLIEKSKRGMIAEDIRAALSLLG